MRKVLTAEQQAARAERQAKFRALWKQVADMGDTERAMMAAKYGFQSCEGWGYSPCNQMLIALQLPQASILGGFGQWIRQGRAVRKGEHGAMVWCPVGHKAKQEEAAINPEVLTNQERGGSEGRSGFIVGTIFDVSQTQELESEVSA